MSGSLTNARFFFDSDVHFWLFNKTNIDYNNSFSDNYSFSYDIIDQPFHCEVCSGDGHIETKLYIRNELGMFLESPDLAMKFSAKDEKAEITENSGQIGGDQEEQMMLFYKAAVVLGMQIEENGLVDSYSNMDIDEEGVIVSLSGEELSFERVYGKSRPAMACTTLFGGVQMMRPYQNEIMENWMDELLPLEEKIELAENGDREMMEQLANLYINGDDEVDIDPEKAVYWFTKLADLDDPNAQFNLGLHCAKGFGIERSFEKAAYWLECAAKNGDSDAPTLLEKIKKAVAAEKIVDTGDAQAQADLAEVYMFIGNSLEQAGPEEDYAIALDYAQKAAMQKNGDGLWIAALAYQHGRGVAENIDKAIQLYKLGASIGHAPSQHSLGCFYFRGDVLEYDPKKAMDLVEKSAVQGYKLAELAMAQVYASGDGVDVNFEKAMEWAEKAGINADADTQYEVAKIFTYFDDGKMLDTERAKYWYGQAAGKGHIAAQIMLEDPFIWENIELDMNEAEEYNLFTNTEFMPGASEQEFFDRAVEEIKKLNEISADMEGLEEVGIANNLVIAIALGVKDDNNISDQEARMIKYVIEKTIPDYLEYVQESVEAVEIEEALLRLQLFSIILPPTAISALANIVLCFAYVDGVFDERVSQELSNVLTSSMDIFEGTPEDYILT